jgi:hypothetical protein
MCGTVVALAYYVSVLLVVLFERDDVCDLQCVKRNACDV